MKDEPWSWALSFSLAPWAVAVTSWCCNSGDSSSRIVSWSREDGGTWWQVSISSLYKALDQVVERLPEAKNGEEESLGELHDDCFVSFVYSFAEMWNWRLGCDDWSCRCWYFFLSRPVSRFIYLISLLLHLRLTSTITLPSPTHPGFLNFRYCNGIALAWRPRSILIQTSIKAQPLSLIFPITNQFLSLVFQVNPKTQSCLINSRKHGSPSLRGWIAFPRFEQTTKM